MSYFIPSVLSIALFAFAVWYFILGNIEKNSQHPLAEAIVRRAEEQGIELEESESFDTFGGKGVIANIAGNEVLIGNRTLFDERHIMLSHELEDKVVQLETEGKTTILVALDSAIRGIIAIADTLKESTKDAIKAFKDMRLNVVMITGDNARTAHSIAGHVEKICATCKAG